MSKNIEIKIKDEIFEKLNNESIQYKMDIESYITMVLENHDDELIKNKNYIEEKIKKPLKKILSDLDQLSEERFISLKKISLFPLNQYNKPLSKSFNRLIQYYKNKGWYDQENFYLIKDEKSMVGYIGLNMNEEDPPYGRYLFIYALNLQKEYQNNTNIKYIINFIQSIGRKKQCYNMDVLLQSSNLNYDQLKEMGFSSFVSTDMIKINIEKNQDKINMDCLENEKCSIQEIKEFVPIAKTEPFRRLLNQWREKQDTIQVYKNKYQDKNEEIEFLYIKEDKVIHKIIYNYYTLLVDPNYSYDDSYIIKILSIFKCILSKNKDNDKKPITCVPQSIHQNLLIYEKEDRVNSINWLRKNNS